MTAISKLAGLLCFAGILAYWYFLPYQSYLTVMNAGNLLGPIVVGLTLFFLLTAVGIAVTVILAVLGFVLIRD